MRHEKLWMDQVMYLYYRFFITNEMVDMESTNSNYAHNFHGIPITSLLTSQELNDLRARGYTNHPDLPSSEGSAPSS